MLYINEMEIKVGMRRDPLTMTRWMDARVYNIYERNRDRNQFHDSPVRMVWTTV